MLRGQRFGALRERRHRLRIVDQHLDGSVRNELIELHDALRWGIVSFGDSCHECGRRHKVKTGGGRQIREDVLC